jgi:predicted transcriptional regulator
MVIPPKLGERASVRLDDDLRKDLRLLCVDKRMTVSDVIRNAVRQEAAVVRQRWERDV